jgi:hypothetical protein
MVASLSLLAFNQTSQLATYFLIYAYCFIRGYMEFGWDYSFIVFGLHSFGELLIIYLTARFYVRKTRLQFVQYRRHRGALEVLYKWLDTL